MNLKAFKKIINKTDLKIDFSESSILKPNTTKIIIIDGVYCAFEIDECLNKKLIVETTSMNRFYSDILKYHGIKIDRKFNIINNTNNSKR